MNLHCPACGERYPLDTGHWHCTCGGVFVIEGAPPFRPADITENESTLWRYRAALSFDPVPANPSPMTLGEGWTPLISANIGGHSVLLKLESLNPTGSFKDRGAVVLMTLLKAQGISRVVEDSSGNAGAALAAYGARAGIAVTLYVPAHTSPAKRAQIAAYGATLVPVEGPRERVAAAAQAAVAASNGREGTRYASHVYHPVTLLGLKTVAYELWEQLGGCAPARVVLPVGQGTLLLGCFLGFSDLLAAGLIERLPRLYGVQAATCAPLAQAYAAGACDVSPVAEGETLAAGVRVARPIRSVAVLEAVRSSDGAILAVDESSIAEAHATLARAGFYVEPTAALTAAALEHLPWEAEASEDGRTILLLTGNGLKQPFL